MNAETDVSLSAEGAVRKNLPASAVESVNRPKEISALIVANSK